MYSLLKHVFFTQNVDSLDAPKISNFANNEPLNEGSHFSALCSVYKGSLPLFFQWTKDNQVITDDHFKIASHSERSSILSIEKVRSSDSGNYSCSVSNAFGSDSQTIILIIKGSHDYISVFHMILDN